MSEVFQEDVSFYPVMLNMLGALQQEITDRGLPGLCSLTLVPGIGAVLDKCGCESGTCRGMGWVRLAALQPIASLNDPASARPRPCMVALGATIEVGIMRCLPVPPRGASPTDEELLEATRLQLADAAALRAAALCSIEDRAVEPQSYAPTGPEGGCVGGVWTVIVSEF